MGKSAKKSATKVEAAPAVIKDSKPLKKVIESSSGESSDSDESESEEEKETPKKKNTDVEMVDAEQKSYAKQPKTPATPATGGSKTLFAANLPFQVERSDVENFFKEAGEVVDVRFATDREDGRFKGYGHVEFATAEAAQKALSEFNGRPLLGREIRLDIAVERGERQPYTPQSGNFRSGGGDGAAKTIFVKGFDSSLPEDDIKSALSEHFASCGEITRVSVPIDRETGASKGFAYVDFKEGTEKALELNGSEMSGWNLVVDESRPRDNGGGRSGGYGGRSGGRDGGRRGRGGRDFGGRSRGRGGRDGGRDFGRGRGNRPSFTPQGKKTTFNDE
ncbi:unnamed protein product [Thlaspi arvense]|uniref:RRM domain-containing protein n=1 Tax=Thlaspi arvense TaxID=13288 RepID=A0AAU9RBV5_THLAR|nr:unnamed protein product [Thlaspi arvense]